MLDLRANALHLWICRVDHEHDGALMPMYRGWLDREESARYERFRFEKDRRLFLTSHAFLRDTLSRYIPLHPAAWRFRTNRFGRPRALLPSGEDAPLYFSLSHTTGLALLALARRRTLGADAETLDRRVQCRELAERFFSRREATLVATARDETEARDRFFRIWTLKEAYIKARGGGLSIPLERFSVGITATPPRLEEVDPDGGALAHWYLWSFPAGQTHRIAVALYDEEQTLTHDGIRLAIRESTPGLGAEPLTPLLLAQRTICVPPSRW